MSIDALMAYYIKEIYFTLQGEGIQSGRPSVFCRFTGCNLWSGVEKDRNNSACWFCDTDFVGTNGPGGGKFKTAESLAEAIAEVWPANKRPIDPKQQPHVVFTGGEPALQLDDKLLHEVKKLGFSIAVETNGTKPLPDGIDWLTVSPKPNSTLEVCSGNELKLVFPHEVHPDSVENLDFDHFLLSPLASASKEQTEKNLRLAIEFCLSHPKWRVTMQHHKLWQLP